VDFDTFHKTSAKLIRKSIFGTNSEGKINPELLLPKNNLVVTNVDIQNVEPVDEKTRQSLQKTVTLAIQISTKKQKAAAEHQAEKLKQESKGELEKLQIEHQSRAEETMRRLLELKAQSEQVKQEGLAVAKAKAEAEAEELKSEANLKITEKMSKARKIENEAVIEKEMKKNEVLFQHEKLVSELEIKRA
jgi:major vault protein